MEAVTVKIGTHAQTCYADGTFCQNIRPLPFSMDMACEVVKTGTAPARGFARGYTWYVVKVFGSHVFVTDRDIREEQPR